MSAPGRRVLIPVWFRIGVPAGIISFAITLVGNLAILIVRPSDLCRLGPLVIPIAMLSALGAFVLLAAIAGFITGRITGVVGQAVLSGLIMAAISGVALVTVVLYAPNLSHRINDLSERCPGSGPFTVGSTPPPGVVIPSPPPGFGNPFGGGDTVSLVVGFVANAFVGLAVGGGAAALGGSVGSALRPSSDQARRP